MKLWSGRFEKETNQAVDDFNSSIRFDQRMYQQDIAGSIAHVTMLGQQQILTADEVDLIIGGLTEIEQEIVSGKIAFQIEAEDIHMNIESLLTEKIGNTAKKLHTGRSRNDQVAVDIRLYTRQQIDHIDGLLFDLMQVLFDLSQAHTETIMPGYTHLQRAQPTTLSHHLMAYFEMFKRDRDRLHATRRRLNVCPLGAGAFATTTYPLDRNQTAELLGFDGICLNSMDAVSDRDFLLDLLHDLAVIMMHLSRFSEEIILWSSHEFKFIELDDAYSTGSSIMPQKKNPDIAELVRGKTGRVYGNLMALLTTMKGLPLAYNKDMQEDKEAIFDSIDTVKACLSLFGQMLKTITFHTDIMYQSAAGGFTNATDAADYLVGKGLPFRDAHEIIGKLVLYCIEQQTNLNDLSLDQYQALSPLFGEDIYQAVGLKQCVNRRMVPGGPAKPMMEQILQINQTYLVQSPALNTDKPNQ